MTRNCIFCRVMAGEWPMSLVAEQDLCVAFLDLHPVNPGHTLIVPKRHAVTFTDLTPGEAAAMAQLAQRVAQAQQCSDLPGEGFNLWMANGEAAGQDVFHAHMHVFPRLKGDAFRVDVAPIAATRNELDAVAAQLRAALERA